MLKKIIALLLCLLMMIPVLSACAKRDENDQGPMITMYLADEIYNFDPAYAYYNSSTLNIVSLMFETLFKLDSNGIVQPALVDTYEYIENPDKNEYKMVIELKETYWSNRDPITADNVVYTWKRLLDVENSFEAASLLFDIKNARAVKEGDISIDDLGVEANTSSILTIFFEGAIDVDAFLLNLTSVATAPLPESYIEKDADWAKKGATMICSGPFKLTKTRYVYVSSEDYDSEIDPSSPEGVNLIDYVYDDYALDEFGKQLEPDAYNFAKRLSYFVLERNTYYYRDPEEDKIDKSVTPHRLLINCMMSAKELEAEFRNNHIFYIGNIPCSLRTNANSTIAMNAKVSDSMSTFSLYLNQDAVINGEKLFANKDVRQALSLAIDRTEIAEALVYAKAATGLVPNGVFESGASQKKLLFFTDKAEMFRDHANNDMIAATADMKEAKSLLSKAGIDPSLYSFSVNVAHYDEANIIATEMIVKAWCKLGFNVTINMVKPIENNDILKAIAKDDNNVMTDICDDLFIETLTRETYQVIAFDYTAFSPDAYSVLSSFAKSFSGMSLDMKNYILQPHRTGYDSEEYNNLMEAIYYVPYFANLDRETSSSFLGIYDSKEEFQAVYDAVKAIYDANGITPSNEVTDWREQKAALLHKAEELLLTDMPVIPVLFNQHASTFDEKTLKDVSSDYYVPDLFSEATLKDYLDYTYINKQGKLTSIFASFPEINWDDIGVDYSAE